MKRSHDKLREVRQFITRMPCDSMRRGHVAFRVTPERHEVPGDLGRIPGREESRSGSQKGYHRSGWS